MFFDTLVDVLEENADLVAHAIDVAHHTHEDILGAIGIHPMIPVLIKDLIDNFVTRFAV